MTTREEGKSPFPLARVQRIIKADKEMGTVTRESVLLVALATEQFLQRMAKASSQVAKGEKRVMVRDKDVEVVVKRSEEFQFLRDVLNILPVPEEQPAKKAKPGWVHVDDEENAGEDAGEKPEQMVVEDAGEDSEPVVHDDSGSEDDEGE